jgi:hypothetical protein
MNPLQASAHERRAFRILTYPAERSLFAVPREPPHPNLSHKGRGDFA